MSLELRMRGASSSRVLANARALPRARLCSSSMLAQSQKRSSSTLRSKRGNLGDDLLDYMAAGPKLRKWYGEGEREMPRDGGEQVCVRSWGRRRAAHAAAAAW